MSIKIPEKIRIFAKTYRVEYTNSLTSTTDCSAEIAYREQVIRLQPNCEGIPRHHEMIEISFFHELMHGCLYELNYMKLKDDEEFVNRIANVLYAALRDSGMLVINRGDLACEGKSPM